ncbi:MAG: hypothetical protein P8129_25990 [Anaerolineae bacterium]
MERPHLWIPVLALLVVLTLLAPSLATRAGSSVAGPHARDGGSARSLPGMPAATLPGTSAGTLPGVEAGTQFSQTLYLPLLANRYQDYADSGFGIQIFGTNAALSTKLADMGAKWVRMPLNWSYIEPVNTTPENYAWSAAWEQELLRLRGRGVNFVLTLTGNPAWAATYPGGPVDKVDPAELVEFMEAVVARYGAPGHQPQAYVDLLQSVYDPIKAVDPEAQIVFGGVAYDAFEDPWGGPFVRSFLDGVLANGGGDYFDVMNFHYYLSYGAEWAPYGIDILGKYNYLRDKLASYGVYKAFVCTETAMWSDSAHDGSDELQSRYVSQVFARSMSARFRFTIWFRLFDDGELGTVKVGLLDPIYIPKPAYRAYQTLARQLGGTVYVRTWSWAETGSSALEVYEFAPEQGQAWSDGATRIILAWTNDEGQHPLLIQAGELVQVDKYGVEQTVQDGDDGLVDGAIRLSIGPSPVYLRLVVSSQ